MLEKNGIKDNLFKPDKKEKQVKIKKEKLEITDELSLIYDSKYNFSQYRNIRRHYNIYLEPKYCKLLSFYYRLNELWNLMPQTEKTNRKKNLYKNLYKSI